MSNDDEILYFNGVNATRGVPAREPMTNAQLAALIRGDTPGASRLDPDKEQRDELKRRNSQVQQGHFGVKEGVDEKDLAQTGWAVVFPAGEGYAAVREALAPLLSRRKAQAGARYREGYGPNGYRPGEGRREFLLRVGAATSGPADPDKFPFYVLLVGSPEEIPFRFQYQLDVQYAVGRLHFDDLQGYDSYARSVVAAEEGQARLGRKLTFFAAQSPDDVATRRSANDLIKPLARGILDNPRTAAEGWTVETVAAEQATKARLSQILGGPETPALLFTASHGVEFDQLDPRQIPHQGAILCSDWPGPRQWGHRAVPPSFYMAGDDVASDAQLLGTIAFHFACFGAGTPRLDDFPHEKGAQAAIAPHAFLAGLPKRLLGHPKGGALAVIGHVERAWTYSFSDAGGARQVETFSSTLRRMMLGGAPVGFAVEYFNDRYAELATGLTEDMENLKYGTPVDEFDLTKRWTEHNDARSYVVLGDPAVRLPLAAPATPAQRTNIPEVHVPNQTNTGVVPAPTESGVSPAPPAAQPVPAQPEPVEGRGSPPPATASSRPPSSPSAPAASFSAQPPATPTYAPGSIIIYQGYPPPGSGGLPPPTAAGTGGLHPPPGDEDDASFGGLFGGGEKNPISDATQKLTAALQEFADRLGQTMKKTIEDAAHLEVETYVADDLTQVNYRGGDFSGAQLRAVTRMALDGDTQVIVPRSGGQLDEELWHIHTSMVQQAQQNRAEMIRAIAAAAAGLLVALQGK